MSATPTPTPTPAAISAARKAAGLTQAEAAALVRRPWRTWQNWEYGVSAAPPEVWADFIARTAACRAARRKLARDAERGA